MGRIDISFENVRQKNTELMKKIQSELDEDIIGRYKKLQSCISQSGGDGVEAIMEEVYLEEEALSNIRDFMVDLVTFIQDSADAFEEVDIAHERAANNIG